MASSETADLRAMSDADLRSQMEESHRALFNLRFQASTRQLADVSQVRAARRRIARLKTLMREREILTAYEAGGGTATATAKPPAAAAPAVEDEPVADEAATDEPADDDAGDDDGASDAEEQE